MTITTVSTRRAVAYRRVSTKPQASERRTSLEEQQEHIARYCREHDLSLLAEPFTDVDSGRKDNRREYQRMVRYALDGNADVVLVQWLDRFGRNAREILRRVWELQENGVEVLATDEDVREELMLLLKAGIAAQESRRTAERTKEKFVAAARKGTHFGRAPYGYKRLARVDPADPKRMIVWYEQEPVEAAAVREMVRLYVQENLGYKAIAFEMDRQGVAPREAEHWSNQTVRGVLRNPALVGTTDYKPRDGELIVFEGKFDPPILSPDEWQALQTRLAIRGEHPRGRTQASDFLLSGTARCGACGGPLVGTHSWVHRDRNDRSAGYRKYPRYACSNWQRNRALCSVNNSHSAPKLERAILAYLGQYTDPERVRELLLARSDREQDGATDLKRVEQDLLALDRDFKRDLDRLDRGIYDEDTFKRANDIRQGKRKALQSRQSELAARVENAQAQEAMITVVPARVRSFLEDVEHLDVRKAKALLQGILSAAHVYRDGRIELEFRT